MTYTGVLATVFTGIEPAVALSLACVPFLRPLLRGTRMGTGTDSQYASTTLRSKDLASNGNRAFKELNDDSSEIQLRPMEGEQLKYEAEVGQEQKQGQGAKSEGAILVKKHWDVVSKPGSP
jgi:hypothetical protein